MFGIPIANPVRPLYKIANWRGSGQTQPCAGVTSSCLCKKPEGAVFPFGLLVHSVEDGIDNPIHAADIDEADHGPRAASYLDEATLDDVGGAELRPKVTGEVEEGEQLGQVLLQAL